MLDSLDPLDVLTIRSGGVGGPEGRPPVFKIVGIALAVASGLFIGVSFVLKKVGLLRANVKYNEEAGEGYGYLRNGYWWGGMTLMVVGEICNFVAYAFVDAILVTPLGALSVVVTTVLSAIFLKERLSFVGMVGCFNCILGSVVIAMHAPTQSSVGDIQDMKRFVISPGFLSYGGVIIVACVILAVWAAPRWGKKNMFVYITICSLVGGLSVVATQGLGAAIIAQIQGKSQFKEWFLYVLLVFVIATLLTEIVYLNVSISARSTPRWFIEANTDSPQKALNIFNAALVTPTYYVIFTSATIITSAVLFQGFKGSAISITTIVMGFLQICAGVILLQFSKSAKDVPDAAVFKGDLDQVREVAGQEQPETEPKADAIRGAAAIIRRISSSRRRMEVDEARRVKEEQGQPDNVEGEGEGTGATVEWDGLRRRVVSGESALTRTKSVHPPWGMSRFPEDEDEDENKRRGDGSVFGGIWRQVSGHLRPNWRPSDHAQQDGRYVEVKNGQDRHVSWADSVNTEIDVKNSNSGGTSPPSPPLHGVGRNFSFQRIFSGISQAPPEPPRHATPPQQGGRFFGLGSPFSRTPRGNRTRNQETEEESLGLVKTDSEGGGSREATSRITSPTLTQPDYGYNLDKETLYRQESLSSISSSSSSSFSNDSRSRFDHTHPEPHLNQQQEEDPDDGLPPYDAMHPSPTLAPLRPLPLRPQSQSPPHPPTTPPQPQPYFDPRDDTTHHLTQNPFLDQQNPAYTSYNQSHNSRVSLRHSPPRSRSPPLRGIEGDEQSPRRIDDNNNNDNNDNNSNSNWAQSREFMVRRERRREMGRKRGMGMGK